MNKPYRVTCQKCGKEFCSSSTRTKYHAKCKPKRIVKKYNSDFGVKSLIINNRDNYTCQLCDEKFSDSFDLHVHHINGNSQDDRATNLVSLCIKCHRIAEKEKLKFSVDDCDMEIKEEHANRMFFKKDRKYFYKDC